MASRHPSNPEIPVPSTACVQVDRLSKIDERMDESAKRLAAGDIQFALLTSKVDMLVTAMRWLTGVIALYVLSTVGDTVLRAIQHMGTKA